MDYPSYLRGAIQQGKARNVATQFIGSQPLAGTPYFQPLTDESPVTWDFRLIFNTFDALAFDAWFVSGTNNGNDYFDMPIRTEQGLIVHNCHFLPDGIPNRVSEDGGVFTYSCSVIARAIVRPIDPAEILALREAGYTAADLSLIDRIINDSWLEANEGIWQNGLFTFSGLWDNTEIWGS